jgi:hypothetical protein
LSGRWSFCFPLSKEGEPKVRGGLASEEADPSRRVPRELCSRGPKLAALRMTLPGDYKARIWRLKGVTSLPAMKTLGRMGAAMK